MEKSLKFISWMLVALTCIPSSLVGADNDPVEIARTVGRLAADGKCSFSGPGAVNPFLIVGKLSGVKINACYGAMRCEGLDVTRGVVMDAYEDGSCPTLEAYGRAYYDKVERGDSKGMLGAPKESKPRAWESISASTRCAYESPVLLTANPQQLGEGEKTIAPPHFCAAIVVCDTKQTDGSWVEQPRTVFACPVVKQKKFADGREFEAETDFCPSVSECYAQQGPAGFTVTKGKIREATPADAEFLAAKDKKRESNLIPSRGRTLAQGRPSIDGSPTSNASETTPGEVHGPAPVRRDPNYLVTTSDPRPTSAQ